MVSLFWPVARKAGVGVGTAEGSLAPAALHGVFGGRPALRVVQVGWLSRVCELGADVVENAFFRRLEMIRPRERLELTNQPAPLCLLAAPFDDLSDVLQHTSELGSRDRRVGGPLFAREARGQRSVCWANGATNDGGEVHPGEAMDSKHQLIGAISGGDAARMEDGLSAGYARQILTFALGKDGAPHIATDATDP